MYLGSAAVKQTVCLREQQSITSKKLHIYYKWCLFARISEATVKGQDKICL